MGTSASRCTSGHCVVLGPLFFLIYINDLSQNLSTNTELFADDKSIFSTARSCKKQAQEVIFSRKRVKDCHPSVFFQ